jgi:hypothetical protein
VFYIFDPIDPLHDTISYTVSMFGEVGHWQRDRIDVLIDRGAKHGARVVMKICWVVGASAEKTDPKRGSRDIDH